MTSREVESLLAEYTDDALGGEQRRGLDAHLGSCADCRQLVKQLDASLALFVAHQPPLEGPAIERIWRRVRSEALDKPQPRRRLWATALAPSLAAAAAVVLAIIVWLPRPQLPTSESRVAAGAPRSPVRPRDATTASSRVGRAFLPATPHGRRATRTGPRRGHIPAHADRGTPPASPTVVVGVPDVVAERSGPTQPTTTHDYAVVVTEWTVREYDQVLTIAEDEAASEGAEAEPVRTSLYAVVPKAYGVSATAHVLDEVADVERGAEAEPDLAPGTGPSGAAWLSTPSVHAS